MAGTALTKKNKSAVTNKFFIIIFGFGFKIRNNFANFASSLAENSAEGRKLLTRVTKCQPKSHDMTKFYAT